MEDTRFAHISTDPRFKKTPKSIRKVKIDKRFQSLFTDKRFQVNYSVDKRGRPVNQSSHENFKKYYAISSDDESDEKDSETDFDLNKCTNSNRVEHEENLTTKTTKLNRVEHEENLTTKTPKLNKVNKWVVTPNIGPENDPVRGKIVKPKTNQDVNNVDESEKACLTDDIKMKLRDPNTDYARGVGTIMSDSSSEEESSDSGDDDEEEVEHCWGELDRDAEVTDDATDRLAVLHMDWDRIRAVDLMVLFNSFLPPEGVIESITIYPSQFGLERMKEEEEKGPIELVNTKVKVEVMVDEESKEGQKYHMERLRQYQLNRLKYYYAIIKFDSLETANKVYTECDGLEYESSSTKLDLRFVPEDETFDQEPHEVCTSMPDPGKYEPRIFTNTALQQGKVELTWDENDPDRLEFTKKIQRNADKIDNTDLQDYLAYSSDDGSDRGEDQKGNEEIDSENEQGNTKEEDKIARYKSLLASLEEEEENKKNRDVDLEITWGVGLKEKTEKAIKEKINAPQTPFEEMLEKRRQKKKLKRETKLKQKEKSEDNSSDGDLYSDDDVPSDIDLNDQYFKEEITGKGTNLKKNKKNKNTLQEESDESKQNKAELELLLMEENDEEKQKSHFNLKSIQNSENMGKKKKRRKQLKKKPKEIFKDNDDFQVDISDERFGAIFSSHHFNIDPADPHYHETNAMKVFKTEKLKRRQNEHLQEIPAAKQVKSDPELSLLVKSIKNKTKHKLK